MLTFRDLWVPVARRFGDVSQGAISNAKEFINRIAREMAQRATWPHLCDEKAFVTADEHTTGTVDVTQGAVAIAGTATAWPLTAVGQTFSLDGSEDRYKVRAYTSATALDLDRPYAETTAVTQDYRLIRDEYALERDTIGVIRMNIPSSSRLIAPGEMHRYYEVRDSIESAGTPDAYFHVGATSAPYYASGSVTATNGSTTVTGAGTSWDDTMVGRMIRFFDDMPRRMYRIAAVGGATALTLQTAYRGIGGDAISYEIDPAGIPLVKLFPRPDDAYSVYYYRKRAPAELFEDDEPVADWPEEFADALILGASYLALKERGELQMATLEKGEYEKALATRIASTAVTEPNMTRQINTWGAVPRVSSFPGNYPAWMR